MNRYDLTQAQDEPPIPQVPTEPGLLFELLDALNFGEALNAEWVLDRMDMIGDRDHVE